MSNQGDPGSRRLPSTKGDQAYHARYSHAGSRRGGSDRPPAPAPTHTRYEQQDSQEAIPRFSEPPVYSNPIFSRGSEATPGNYSIRSSSQSGPRPRDERSYGDSVNHAPPRSTAHSDRRQSPERVTIHTSRTTSGRAPSSYRHYQQAPFTGNPQTNPESRTSYGDPHPPPTHARRFSSYQDADANYYANTSHRHRNDTAILDDNSDDDDDRAPNQHTLSIRDRVPVGTVEDPPSLSKPSTNYNYQASSPIAISAAAKTYDANVRTSYSAPTINQVAAGGQSTTRPSASSFRSSLSPVLQEFANIARNDWKTIETHVTRDHSILKTNPQLFLNESVQAFTIGKDSYANQCIHRAALLRHVEGSSFNDAIKSIKNIRDRKPEAEEFIGTYDRSQKAAKDRAKLIASTHSGQVSVQHQIDRQDTPRALNEKPRYAAPQVSAAYNDHAASVPQISAVPEQRPHVMKAETLTSYHTSAQTPDLNSQGGSGHPDGRTYRVQTSAAQESSPVTGVSDRMNSRFRNMDSDNYPSDPQEEYLLRPNPSEASDDPGPVRGRSASTASLTRYSVTGENTLYYVPGQQDRLDGRYQIRPHSFFKVGTVFAVVWHVPASNEPSKGYTSTAKAFTVGKYGEKIYTTIRRMVVVREGYGYCVCIQINTYGGRGLKKFSRRQEEVENHSLIHMTDTRATYIDGEPMTSKKPIAVEKAASYSRLDPESRLCYSQPSTVQHNVKAMHVGQVTRDSLPWLSIYYKKAQEQ